MLRVLTEIDPDKRQEFLQAIRTFMRLSKGDKHCLYNSVDSENSYCLLVDCDGQKQLEAYLESSQFQFFSGAASVLGRIVDAEIIDSREVTPIPNLMS